MNAETLNCRGYAVDCFLDDLCAQPEECLMIGDALFTDEAVAAKAGMAPCRTRLAHQAPQEDAASSSIFGFPDIEGPDRVCTTTRTTSAVE